MDARSYHYTLRSFLQEKPAVIDFRDFQIKEGEIVEINYTYTHSKSLIITEIIKEALKRFDYVLYLDMSMSIDFSEITELDRILIYKIFTAPEFFMYMCSIESFLRDCKRRVVIIIDSWNTYLWNEKSREGLLDHTFDRKIFEILLKLQAKFPVTSFICRKSSISHQLALKCSLGSFALNKYERNEKVSQTFLVLEPIISDNGVLLHAVCADPPTSIHVFTYPFQWISREEILSQSQT